MDIKNDIEIVDDETRVGRLLVLGESAFLSYRKAKLIKNEDNRKFLFYLN